MEMEMDQERIERALDACYEAVASPQAWRQALDEMSVAMGAAAIMFYPKDLSADSAPVPCSQAYDDFLPDFIAGGWYDGHYRSERGWPLLRRADTTVIIEHQLATDEERRSLPHYNELYLPKGYPGFAAIGFNVGNEQWAMCVLRDHSQGFFTLEESERMVPLAGHFSRMVRLAEKFESSCISTSLAALDKMERAAAVLGKDGRICAMNPACEALLTRSSASLTVRGGKFVAAHPEANRDLQRLVHALTAAGHGDRRDAHAMTVAVARQDRPPVLLEGLSIAVLGLEHTVHAHSVLIFYDPDLVPAQSADKIRATFHLTPAEADFATLLAAGQGLGEIADAQSITKETARQRLKSIFSKTDTHRQGELVSLLGRLRG